jgi:hypothetical protein
LLGILSHGEAEAWAFVMGLPPDIQAPADASGEAADAARLAASFRALALMLCAMLARTALFANAAVPPAGRPLHGISGLALRWPAAPAVPIFDTS